MSVMIVPTVIEGAEPRCEDALSQCESLHLKGMYLCDKSGYILAELVHDKENDRYFWKLMGGTWASPLENKGKKEKPKKDPRLFQELHIFGVGKHM